MDKNRNLRRLFLFMVTAALLFSAGVASAVVKPLSGGELLLDTYHRHMSKLEKNSFGLPLIIESFERNDKVHVDVYGVFAYSFGSVVNVLKVPANWCDIVPLHPNVKACTYSAEPDAGLLTFYIGKKTYQSPEEARQVLYLYRNVTEQSGYLDLLLSAESGPFGTEDHKMRFEALPLDGGRTFVHVGYEYNDSLALRLAGKAYFATLGRSKVGFTVTGSDSHGQPVYICGPRGAIERNAVRYFFAIQSFMTTRHSPESSLFRMRISNWYDLTTRYRPQLFDLDKKDYLAIKTTEHANQLKLQGRINAGLEAGALENIAPAIKQ